MHYPKIYVADIEANGFYDVLHTIWCIWFINPNNPKDRKGFRPNEIEKAIAFAEEADILAFHNGIDFDVPAIRKIFPNFKCPKIFDTLVVSRMVEPDRFSHSLDSYGKELNNKKGDYGKQENAWDKFTESMYDYCEQDVSLNVDVYHTLCEAAGFDPLNPPAYQM